MTLFVDASAMVSIITGENDADALSERLASDRNRIISPMAVWESVVAVRKNRGGTVDDTLAEVERYCTGLNVRLVEIGINEARAAALAHGRYGKRSGHPARLNMGDCFAYACAKTNGAKLLYKGDDFIHTYMK